jgi:hypothetical protein
MAVVGTLTAIGLATLGVAALIALGPIAGMFAFVPYVGPILASFSGILMAAMQGPMLAVYVVVLYATIHFVEGNLITPLVQAEAIELPPVLTLFDGSGLWTPARSGRRPVGGAPCGGRAGGGQCALHRRHARRAPCLAVQLSNPGGIADLTTGNDSASVIGVYSP